MALIPRSGSSRVGKSELRFSRELIQRLFRYFCGRDRPRHRGVLFVLFRIGEYGEELVSAVVERLRHGAFGTLPGNRRPRAFVLRRAVITWLNRVLSAAGDVHERNSEAGASL
jgi:hypothetical protein